MRTESSSVHPCCRLFHIHRDDTVSFNTTHTRRIIPPTSPFGLIQESIWKDEWLLLVVCVMLNRTSRKQVERVLPKFVHEWPNARVVVDADVSDLANVIRPLGFCNRRASTLKKLSEAYLSSWSHVSELPGVGDYAAASHEIFCCGNVPATPPKDHALSAYVEWYNGLKNNRCLP